MAASAKELEQLIPGLADLRVQEREAELKPWLAPERLLCGVWVRPLTLRHVLELEFAGNRFYSRGEVPQRADVYLFLWRLSVSFTRSPRLFSAAWWARRSIKRIARRRTERALVRSVQGFIAESEQDRPPAKRGDPNAVIGMEQEPGFHWAASYVNFFGEEYAWPDDKTLDTSISKLNQLYRAHRAYHGSPIPSFRRSDRVIADAVKSARAQIDAQKGGNHGSQ